MAHMHVADAGAIPWQAPRAFRLGGWLGGWRLGWIGLLLLALASLLPLTFSATATLVFDMATQPPAAAVRGVSQILASRALALDAVGRLEPRDRERLAAPRLADGFGLPGRARAAGRPVATRAALRLAERLAIAPAAGGRALTLTLSAPTPALAARAADAYVAAFLALDAEARAEGPEADTLARLRPGATAHATAVPEPPRPLVVVLLLVAAFILHAAQRHFTAAPEAEGPVDGSVLPVELRGSHRIAWLGGAEGGLAPDAALDRLVAEATAADGPSGLILVTSDDVPAASAALAVALARRLSEDAGVVLVALDGAEKSLCDLVCDPWAPGVAELLFGVAGFGETLHRDTHSRAHVIPPGRDARGGPSVVAAERLSLVLESLKRTYDHVVVAAPSLAAAPGCERIAALDPLVVCLNPEPVPSTAAVESYDALAARHFRRVAMLFLAPEPAARTPQEPPEVSAIEVEVARLLRPAAPPPLADVA